MAGVHRTLFDVVIPSLPGHGFSGKPTTLGWDPIRIARAWIVLMKRLGYTRYGDTADLARDEGEDADALAAVFGIRIFF